MLDTTANKLVLITLLNMLQATRQVRLDNLMDGVCDDVKQVWIVQFCLPALSPIMDTTANMLVLITLLNMLQATRRVRLDTLMDGVCDDVRQV